MLKPNLIVGRHQACDIPLGYPTISLRHCQLDLKDGYWFVRDLGSSNGTSVNGRPCMAEWLLPDDLLSLSVHRYGCWYDPPADRPPPARLATQTAKPMAAAPPIPSSAAWRDKPADQQVWQPVLAGPSLGELVPCGGGAAIPLRRPLLVIGRSDRCDIVLRFAAVSGRHCELTRAGGCWFVRDLGSRNGIRVNEVPCESVRLAPGSILWVGGLRFEIIYSADAVGPPEESPQRRFARDLLDKAGLLE